MDAMKRKHVIQDIMTLFEARKPPRMVREGDKLVEVPGTRAVIPAERLALAKRRLEDLTGLQLIEFLVEYRDAGGGTRFGF